MQDKKVEGYFHDYPKSDECFQTSDGFLFHKDYDAASHARTLEDKRVQHHERKQAKQAVTHDELVTYLANAGKIADVPPAATEDPAAETPKTTKKKK